MSSIISTQFFPSILTISSGIFSGFSISISKVSVPAIRATSDPLPAWQETYNNGKNIALCIIPISVAGGIKCYYDSGDQRYLLVSLLTFAVGAYTGLFMQATNDELFAIKSTEKASNDGKIRQLVDKWSRLQWGRTILSTAAFLTNVWILFS